LSQVQPIEPRFTDSHFHKTEKRKSTVSFATSSKRDFYMIHGFIGEFRSFKMIPVSPIQQKLSTQTSHRFIGSFDENTITEQPDEPRDIFNQVILGKASDLSG